MKFYKIKLTKEQYEAFDDGVGYVDCKKGKYIGTIEDVCKDHNYILEDYEDKENVDYEEVEDCLTDEDIHTLFEDNILSKELLVTLAYRHDWVFGYDVYDLENGECLLIIGIHSYWR